jgi:hypothetical protein
VVVEVVEVAEEVVEEEMDFCSVFAHARPTLAVLWTFPRMFQEDAIFAKCGDEGGGGRGWTKQVDQCAYEYRKTGTHTNRAPKWTRRPRILNSSKSSDLDDEEGSGSGPRCLEC